MRKFKAKLPNGIIGIVGDDVVIMNEEVESEHRTAKQTKRSETGNMANRDPNREETRWDVREDPRHYIRDKERGRRERVGDETRQ